MCVVRDFPGDICNPAGVGERIMRPPLVYLRRCLRDAHQARTRACIIHYAINNAVGALMYRGFDPLSSGCSRESIAIRRLVRARLPPETGHAFPNSRATFSITCSSSPIATLSHLEYSERVPPLPCLAVSLRNRPSRFAVLFDPGILVSQSLPLVSPLLSPVIPYLRDVIFSSRLFHA